MTTSTGPLLTPPPEKARARAHRRFREAWDLWQSSPTRRRASASLTAVGAVAAMTLVAWLRLPGRTAGTVWAEDGGIFLREAFGPQVLGGLFQPYDGYLHVLPRVLTQLALRLGPLEEYATVVSLLSCLCVAMVGALVFRLSRPYVPGVVARILLAVIPVLLPVAPFEVLGNLANLHWYMLWLAPWVLLYRARTVGGSLGLACIAFLAASTEIQTVALAPISVIGVWRDRRRLPAALGLIAGLAMQLYTYLHYPRSVSPDVVPWDVPSVVLGWALQGVVSSFQPSASAVGSAWGFFGGWTLVVPFTFVVAAGIIGWRSGGMARTGFLGFILASGLFWSASQILNNRRFMNYADFSTADWSGFGYVRYAAEPAMFVLGAAVLAVGGQRDQRGGSHEAVAARTASSAPWYRVCAFGVIGVLLGAAYFPSYSARAGGPVWAPQVRAARALCDSDPNLVAAPARVAPRGWEYEVVPIPCSKLRGNGRQE